MPKQINPNLTSWASELDDNALEQALRTSRVPILAGPVCLMADADFGLGATVGSVVATKNALMPSAVGVDIGCGMVAAETNLSAAELPDDLTTLHGSLRDRIPAGVGKGHERSEDEVPPALEALGLPPGSALGADGAPDGDDRRAVRQPRQRQPLRRGLPGRARPRLDRAALGQPGHRQPAGHGPHQDGSPGRPGGGSGPRGPDLACWPRDARSSTPTSPTCCGPSATPAATASR